MERIRLMVSGSAPLAVPVMQRWGEITGHTLLERYGANDCYHLSDSFACCKYHEAATVNALIPATFYSNCRHSGPMEFKNSWNAGMTEIGLVVSNPYNGERVPVCGYTPRFCFLSSLCAHGVSQSSEVVLAFLPMCIYSLHMEQGTVGHAIGGVRVRIVEEGGRGGYTDVAQGQSGELWIAGPTVFDQYEVMPLVIVACWYCWFAMQSIALLQVLCLHCRYWNRPEATAEAFHEEWFRTGDEAVIDREGRVKILGRQSADVLKTGGYKVYDVSMIQE
jgi:acyl-CoA synthetase (AMP-forming)/AMP-acid ligase II